MDSIDLDISWVGETVQYQGQNAMIVSIDIPHVYLNIGKEENLKVKWHEVKKIHHSGIIDIRNN